MCKFVEFHKIVTGMRVAIDVYSILDIEEQSAYTAISTTSISVAGDDDIASTCYYVSETYDEVMDKLRQATDYQIF